jgi:hypothetical protein
MVKPSSWPFEVVGHPLWPIMGVAESPPKSLEVVELNTPNEFL